MRLLAQGQSFQIAALAVYFLQSAAPGKIQGAKIGSILKIEGPQLAQFAELQDLKVLLSVQVQVLQLRVSGQIQRFKGAVLVCEPLQRGEVLDALETGDLRILDDELPGRGDLRRGEPLGMVRVEEPADQIQEERIREVGRVYADAVRREDLDGVVNIERAALRSGILDQ